MAGTTREMKTKLVIEGDADFKKKLKEATTELGNQKSKLKELDAEYKNAQNSQEALAKKTEQLRKVQEEECKAIEAASNGLKNAKSEYDKYTAQVDEANSKIKAAKDEMEALDTSTEEGAKRQKELTDEIEKYSAELATAEAMQKKSEEAVSDWSIQQSKAEKALSDTNTELINTQRYLKEAEESADGYATSIDVSGKRTKQAASDQEELNKKYDNTSAALDSLAGTLAANGIKDKFEEIKEALGECIEAAANFETAMAKVSTIADTESVSLGDIQSSILALSSDTGKAASDLADATYNAISAGVDTASAVEFVATANKLATGGFTDSTTAVDILTTALNAYGLEVDEVSQVSDYLITTQNLGKTTVDELASSLGKVIPIASTYNVEMDNLSAAMAILTANGIATAESTTYLKSALNELGDSGSTVSQTLVEQTGKSFSQLSSEGYSLGDVMEILSKAVDDDKGAFNELWSSSEAGVGALSILSSGSQKYNEVLGQMQKSAGATESAYAQMADTTEMASQKLSNAFDNLKIAVGNELQDQMSGVYEKGADLINWATEFVEANEWVVPVIEGVTTALGLLAAGITGVTLVTKVVIPLWNEFNGVVLSTPVGQVTVAVAALVAILTPLIASMGNTTSELTEQTKEWKSQAAAIRDTTAAYEEQKQATADNASNVDALTKSLEQLTSSEKNSAVNEGAIVELVDQLNDALPDLGLSYDTVTGKLSMTNAELEKNVANLKQQEQYNDASSSYATAYAQQLELTESLAQAKEELAAAEADLADKTQKTGDEQKTGSKYASSYGAAASGAADDVTAASLTVAELRETVEEMTAASEEGEEALADMQLQMELNTIATADMTDSQREYIDARLEAAEALEDSDAYDAEIERMATLAERWDSAASAAEASVETQVQKIQELQEAYDSSYESAYNSITQQLGLFDEMKIGTSESIDSMISGLDSQIEYMDQYAENMRQAMELGVNEGILQQLSDGSEESAAILQEIVNSGSDKIQELNEKFGQVEEGKDEFAGVMAEMETQYSADLDTLVADTETAVQNMAKYDDAYKSAQQTCNGLMAGVDSKWSSVVGKYKALAEAAVKAYNDAMIIQSPSKRFKWSAEMTMAGIEVGVNEKQAEVLKSYTDLAKNSISAYEAEMKKVTEQGSAVSSIARVPQVIKERYFVSDGSKSSTTNNSTTQNFYISTPVKSPSELMRAARLEAKYGLAGA